MNSSYPLLRKRKTYDYDEENKVFTAYNDALNNYNDASGGFNFVFSRQNELDDAKDNLANYGDFSFDINKDAFYKDAVDQYTKLGKLAMEDTIGKASAMTGGYGNSYAQSVGQQAYQGQLDNLNDVGMQLYDRALERYKMGKDDILTQINLLQNESDTEYDRKKSNHDAKVDKLYKEFLIATDNLESYKSELRDEVDLENAEIDALNEMTWDIWLSENSGGASPEVDAEPTIEEDLAPKETRNTKEFIERYGVAENADKAKIESALASFLRNDRISESELLWLLKYYDISE